ncbi:DUF333 domain-containing protein [Shimia haliotis]|uniref:Putative hemolysin n=1 Tax=Shimia haliotis TaxID=1280847 RepID=A0A1I4A4D2_9RHOB|nr:DUF333 domain-containing protein [Shimia haliotis]SFK50811.1 Putative hemolysin [Shimia haliotis]
MKPLFATALFAGTLTLSACSTSNPFEPAYANDPAFSGNYAAEFCTNRGHSYEARQQADGSVTGVCKFGNGGEEDAFVYFRKNATGGSL